MKIVALFGATGGIGRTTLAYHLAWMYQELGVDVLALDLDPQANLTASFLAEERLERLWSEGAGEETVLGAVRPLVEQTGDLGVAKAHAIAEHLTLVAGDPGLIQFEDRLGEAWSLCLSDDPSRAQVGLRLTTVFHRIAESAARDRGARIVLIDLGTGLGAINRAALLGCDAWVMPLRPDLFSYQGLRNVGTRLNQWRTSWQQRLQECARGGAPLPSSDMAALGYVLVQIGLGGTAVSRRWSGRIAGAYHEVILGEPPGARLPDPDPYRLASLKHYRSLVPLAQDARKPMFLLRPADGAIGSHAEAVRACYDDFQQLALRIAERCGIAVPSAA